jgi:lysophospholipase L1-like esterase
MIDRVGTMTAIVRRNVVLEPPKGGLLGRYRADTLAGADGDAIATWPDSSGHGNDLTQTTPGARPVLCHDVAGYRGVWFYGREMLIPAGLSLNRQTFSAFVVQTSVQGGNSGLWGIGVLGDFNLQCQVRNLCDYFGDGSWYMNRPPVSRGWLGVVSSASGVTFHSGELSGSHGAMSSRVVTGGTVGTANGYYGMVGTYNEFLFYDHTLTEAEILQLKTYLRVRYKLPPSPSPIRVVTVGDSLTAGNLSTYGFNYPNQMIPLLSPQPGLYNMGLGGEKVTEMIAEAAAKVDVMYDAAKARNIVAIWGGTNDLYTGDTAENTYANLQTYCAARRAAGWKVVVVTTLPRGANDPFEANRQTYNTSIRAGWATFADALADVAADSRIGDAGDNSDGTYYSDGTHLNNTGYGVVAVIVGAAVQGLI